MKKWKINGMAFVVASSLLISTAMATNAPALNRNEKPSTTTAPSQAPSQAPSAMPSRKPSQAPSAMPSQKPSQAPSVMPSQKPSQAPSVMPSQKPSQAPSAMPSQKPSQVPSAMPSQKPSQAPSAMPSQKPSQAPSAMPSQKPSQAPSAMPSQKPCPTPSAAPGKKPCPEKHKGQHKPFMLDNFKVIACTLKTFGVDDTKLANYISQGKKLEDVLKEENISVRKFKKQVIKEYYKVVDEAEKNGQLTGDQCKQLKAAIKQTIKGWLPKK